MLDELYKRVEARKHQAADQSYSAKLLQKGRAKIAQKLGEEATELVIEAIRDDREKMMNESADLLYHLMVLWVDAEINPDDVKACLEQRRKQSGLQEKQSR
ncbi:MAG: phosphoribosyl-ATP diphosphatase [Alphaproteobacteria bacterium]